MDAINQIEITLQPHQVRPALQSLLLAIFFHRNLDTVEPETREILETHIACAPTPAIEKEINEKVEEFGRKYLTPAGEGGRYGNQATSEKGEIALIFTQKKSRKGWFGITDEIVPWEAHFITIHISPLIPSSSPSTILTDALFRITTFCAERRHSVPVTAPGEADRLSHHIVISPPPPSDLFAPSPPSHGPARSPPPTSRDHTADRQSRTRRSSSPGRTGDGRGYDRDRDREKERDHAPLGYLEQAKDVLRATGARAGAVTGWTSSPKARGG